VSFHIQRSFTHSANLPNFRPIAGGILSHPYDRFQEYLDTPSGEITLISFLVFFQHHLQHLHL